MSRLIDADKLKECDFGEYGYEMRYEIDRQPTIQAIPLDKVKQAREEISKQFVDLQDGSEEWRSYVNETVLKCVEILDNLIESEVGNE